MSKDESLEFNFGLGAAQTASVWGTDSTRMDHNSEAHHSTLRTGTPVALGPGGIEMVEEASKLITVSEFVSSEAQYWGVMIPGDNTDLETIARELIGTLKSKLLIDRIDIALEFAIKTLYAQRKKIFENVVSNAEFVEDRIGEFKVALVNSSSLLPEFHDLVKNIDITCGNITLFKTRTSCIINFENSRAATKPRMFDYFKWLLNTLVYIGTLMNAYNSSKRFLFSTCLNLETSGFISMSCVLFSSIQTLVDLVETEYVVFQQFLVESYNISSAQSSGVLGAYSTRMDHDSEASHSSSCKGTLDEGGIKSIEEEASKLITLSELVSSQAQYWGLTMPGDNTNLEMITAHLIGTLKNKFHIDRMDLDLEFAIKTLYIERKPFFDNILSNSEYMEHRIGTFRGALTNSSSFFSEFCDLVENIDRTCVHMRILIRETSNIINFENNHAATRQCMFDYVEWFLNTLVCLDKLMNAYHRSKHRMFSTCLNHPELDFLTMSCLLFESIHTLVGFVKTEYIVFQKFLFEKRNKSSVQTYFLGADSTWIDHNPKASYSASFTNTVVSLSPGGIQIVEEATNLITIYDFVSSQAHYWGLMMSEENTNLQMITTPLIETLKNQLHIDSMNVYVAFAIKTLYTQRKTFLENILSNSEYMERRIGKFRAALTNSNLLSPESRDLVENIDKTCEYVIILKRKTSNIINFEKSHATTTKQCMVDYLEWLLNTFVCLGNLMNAYHRSKQHIFSTYLNRTKSEFVSISCLMFYSIRTLVDLLKTEYIVFHQFLCESCNI